MSKELARRIALTPPKGILHLAGEPMGKVELKNLVGRDVTIRGLRATSIWMSAVGSLAFEDFAVDFTPDKDTTDNTQAVRVLNSQKLAFTGGRVSGGNAVNGIPIDTVPGSPAHKANKTGNVLGLPCGKGMNLYACPFTTIEEVEFERFEKALLLDLSPDAIIRHNNAHDLRGTPYVYVNGSRLDFSYNLARDSRPWAFGGAGDHGGYFRSWTVPGGKPMDRLRIAHNRFLQGDGEALLGIYLDDNANNAGYTNLEIVENVIYGGHGSGILLERCSGRVEGNTLLWSRRGARGDDVRDTPRIIVTKGSYDLTLARNYGKVDLYKLTDAEKASMRIAV